MSGKAKKIWNIVSTVLVVIVVLFAILLVGVRLFGIQVYSVISGSMEPEYPVGSLIYVKDVDPSQIQVNDVITYVLPNDMPSTHRVIGIDKQNTLSQRTDGGSYINGGSCFSDTVNTNHKQNRRLRLHLQPFCLANRFQQNLH